MHKRTKALAISPKIKAAVWARDGGKCILCGSHNAEPNAHYIARSHSGLGVEQNIVTLCAGCHYAYDNTHARPVLREEIKAYLMNHYEGWNEADLIFKKWPLASGNIDIECDE